MKIEININRSWIKWGINLGLLAAIGMLAWVYGPSVFVEASYRQQAKAEAEAGGEAGERMGGAVGAGKQPSKGFGSLMYSLTGFEELMSQKEEFTIQPVSGEFGLVIPKIFLNVPVIEGVNPSKKEVYQRVLEEMGGVAHSAGTAVPGDPGTVYIFGHSTDAAFNVTRFNALFYLLRKLEPGDEIIAYYYYQPYKYRVVEKKVVDPDDITDILNVENEQRLVLQTCWPPGTSWRRLLIIAKPEGV